MSGATLLTFLGRMPRGGAGYRRASYTFPDGSASEPAAFVGWALARKRRAARILVLGTSGSSWDHLFEGDIDFGGIAEARRLEVLAGSEQGEVQQTLLDRLQSPMAERMGLPVRLLNIPYGRDPDEQAEILRLLADEISTGEAVEIDITHGFRHLPVLALMAALYLRRVRGAGIDHIWYAAFDPDTGDAPVYDLGALLGIARWLEALAIYEHNGDYQPCAQLLPPEPGAKLAQAAFLESVNRVGQARSRAKAVLQELTESPPNDVAARLFLPELVKRLQWAELNRLYDRQRAIAMEYLQRGRFADAVQMGYEAFITGLVQQLGGQPDNMDDRQRAREEFEKAERDRHPWSPRYRAWDSFRRLRNAVVHGAQPKGDEVQRALTDSQQMRELAQDLFEQLLVPRT